mgnify:CR=1 FL=1
MLAVPGELIGPGGSRQVLRGFGLGRQLQIRRGRDFIFQPQQLMGFTGRELVFIQVQLGAVDMIRGKAQLQPHGFGKLPVAGADFKQRPFLGLEKLVGFFHPLDQLDGFSGIFGELGIGEPHGLEEREDEFQRISGLAIRLCLASAGVWWIGFSLITWSRLRPRHAARKLPEGQSYVRVGFKQLWHTLKEMKSFPETLRFLLSYFLYNDGIQTVIAVSATFAAAPIIRGGLEIETGTLSMIILFIQFAAFFGALLWGRLAGKVGAKTSIIISLVIWSLVVIYAFVGLQGENRITEFWILGFFIALVMGGSQAISRSLFSQLIPKGKEAEFYSFYEVSERGTSWIGPLIFGLVNQLTGSLRPAILSLIFFFIMGLIILPFVNVQKGKADVKKYEAENQLQIS